MQVVRVLLALAFVCAVNAAPQIFNRDIFHAVDDAAEVELDVAATEPTVILPAYFQNLINNMPLLPRPPPVQFYRPSAPFQLQLGQDRLFFNWFSQLAALFQPSTTTTTQAP